MMFVSDWRHHADEADAIEKAEALDEQLDIESLAATARPDDE